MTITEDLTSTRGGHELRFGHRLPTWHYWAPVKWRALVIAGAAAGSLSLYLGQGAVALCLLVLVTSAHMPAAGVVRRLAYAVVCLFGLTASMLTVLALSDIAVSAPAIAVTFLWLAAALPPVSRSREAALDVSGTNDHWGAASAAVAFVASYWPFYGASPGRIMARMSYSTDGGTHVGFVREMLDHGGYLLSSEYPPAWSGNVAMAAQLLIGPDVGTVGLLQVASLSVAASYALLTFFSVALACSVLATVAGGAERRPALVATAIVTTYMLAGPGVLLLYSSSYTQIVALTGLVALGTLLSAKSAAPGRTAVLVGLLAVSIMQTWYLVAPVLALVVVLHMKVLNLRWHRVLALAVPFAALSAYPLVHGPDAVQQINTPGGILGPSLTNAVILLLLTLAAVLLLLCGREWRPTGPSPVVTLAVGALVSTTLVFALQVTTGGQFAGYYGVKMLFVVYLIGAVATAAVAGSLCSSPKRPSAGAGSPVTAKWPRAVALAIGLSVPSVVALGNNYWGYLAGQTPQAIDGKVLDAILDDHPRGVPADTDVWVADGCVPMSDRIASKWVHDLFTTWTPSRLQTNWALGTGSMRAVADRAADPRTRQVLMYVHVECDATRIQAAINNPKVSVIRVP